MSLRTRLARVEQTLADIEDRKVLANCVCREITSAVPGHTQEFEAEMNQTCPAHGVRRLGRIMRVQFVAAESCAESKKERLRKEDAELEEVLERYRERLASAEGDSSSSDL